MLLQQMHVAPHKQTPLTVHTASGFQIREAVRRRVTARARVLLTTIV